MTAVDGNHVVTLGGRPALERLEELARSMSEEDREQLLRGPARRARRRRAPGRVRARATSSCATCSAHARPTARSTVGATVEVGQTLQFQIRDARAADARPARRARGPDARRRALLFTCTGRGQRLFGVADHDATVVRDAFGAIPVAGGFCAGELGPVGGHNHVHGFTASLALFH